MKESLEVHIKVLEKIFRKTFNSFVKGSLVQNLRLHFPQLAGEIVIYINLIALKQFITGDQKIKCIILNKIITNNSYKVKKPTYSPNELFSK